MANIKSAKKQARQNEQRRKKNLARRTAVKTAIKKVLTSLEKNASLDTIQGLLHDAESKLARAKNKGVLHANTVRRKISRLAKRVAHKEQEATAQK